MSKATQRQIVAEISPTLNVPGHVSGPNFQKYFASVSGGEISASVEKVFDGNSTFPETLCAPSEISDITVMRYYDPEEDTARLNSLRQLVGSTYYDLAIYTLNCDLKDPASERVYPKALLVGLSDIDGDAASGAPTSFSLTFAISTVAAA